MKNRIAEKKITIAEKEKQERKTSKTRNGIKFVKTEERGKKKKSDGRRGLLERLNNFFVYAHRIYECKDCWLLTRWLGRWPLSFYSILSPPSRSTHKARLHSLFLLRLASKQTQDKRTNKQASSEKRNTGYA